jgi:hypothetical protein
MPSEMPKRCMGGPACFNLGLALRDVQRFDEAHAPWRAALGLFVAVGAAPEAALVRWSLAERRPHG